MPQPTIIVFYLNTAQSDPITILQATSERFTNMKWTPQIGARIVVQQADVDQLSQRLDKRGPGPLENVLANSNSAGTDGVMMTVTEVIYDFLLSDIGILCEHRPL